VRRLVAAGVVEKRGTHRALVVRLREDPSMHPCPGKVAPESLS
jgi:hypothetical protein